LKDLIQAQENDSSTVCQYIQEQGEQLFSESHNGRNFFSIPKTWFVKANDKKTKNQKAKTREENWEG